MADRTVSVRLQAQVTDYLAKMSAAGKATTDLANKVAVAKGRSKAGFTALGGAATVAGGAVVAGLVVATKAMAEFDAKMALVKTLAHATAADMLSLRDAAMHTGQGIGYTASQVADAEAELVKAGVGVKDILGGALHGALTLAAAGQTDVAAATETAAIAMTQFKLSGAAVPHIADLLAAGADKALGSVADLSEGLQSGGLSAAQMGLTIDDTVATLAEFAQSGLLAEKGGTVLRQMFIKLSAPSAAASTELDKLGISAFDASGKFVGMASLAGQLHDKLGPLTEAERNHALAVIFGARAIQGANILVKDGAAGWDKWSKAVNDAGFAQGQATGKLDNLRGDISKLVAALDNDLINAGSNANGSLRLLTQGTTGLLHGFADLPGPVQTAAVAIVGVGGAITFVGGASLLMIPKVQAGRAALLEMGVAGETASAGLGLATKALSVVGVGLVAFEATTAVLNHFFGHKATGPTDLLNDQGKQLVATYGSVDAAISALHSQNESLAASERNVGVTAAMAAGQTVAASKQMVQAIATAKTAVSGALSNDENIVNLFDPTKAGKATDAAAKKLAAARQRLADINARPVGKHGRTVAETQGLAHARQAVADATDNLSKAQKSVNDSSLAATFHQEIAGAQSFLSNIRTVIQRGLDPREVQKLLQAGPTAAAPVLQALVSDNSGALVRMYNDTTHTLDKLNARVLRITKFTAMATAPGASDQLITDLPLAIKMQQGLASAPKVLTGDGLAKFLGMSPAALQRVAAEFGIGLPKFIQQTLNQHPVHVKVGTTVPIGTPHVPHGASFSRGGFVHGGTKGVDSVPAILMPGEFVVRADRSNLRDIAGAAGRPKYRTASAGTTVIHQTTNVDRSAPTHIDTVVAANYDDYQRQLARRQRLARATT